MIKGIIRGTMVQIRKKIRRKWERFTRRKMAKRKEDRGECRLHGVFYGMLMVGKRREVQCWR